MIKSKKGKE